LLNPLGCLYVVCGFLEPSSLLYIAPTLCQKPNDLAIKPVDIFSNFFE